LNRAVRALVVVGTLGICLGGPPRLAAAHSLHRALIAAGAQQAQEKSEAEGHELLFKIINFALLAGGLAYILRKPLADFFAARSNSIRKSLEEGRKALEASQAQLQAVEQKLAHLEEEIAAFKASATKEMEAEQQRMKQAAAEEAEKILESARAQIEISVRAAKLDLKSYTAQQAVQLAEELIRQRLDDSTRKRLVSQFVAGLAARERKN
jgi:F-type H+-transporting ATPase subunit b